MIKISHILYFHLQGSAQIGGSIPNLKEIAQKLRLGGFRREIVSNLSKDDDSDERLFFDTGLRLMLSYQHELASHCFLKCLQLNPNIVLAYGLVALCHSPNYNFKGEAYYESAYHYEDASKLDEDCIFPSQMVADRHSTAGMAIVDDIRRQRKKKGKRGKDRTNVKETEEGGPTVLDVEMQFLSAIRILTGSPGIASDLSEEAVGRPYADAMRKLHQKYPNDSDMSYFFAESLMVLNAWKLYEYPSARPLSPDVPEIQATLERALDLNPSHPGLCHMYVHLSEMSDNPRQALAASDHLRRDLHHAGHLLHMPTHIDVLIGNYDQTIHMNCIAIAADAEIRELCPKTAGLQSFYFGYIVHNYHMAVYGGILGAMEEKSMEIASALNAILSEEMFMEHPSLVSYLEAYASLEVHVLVRFGRWDKILAIPLPKDKNLMLYRTASLLYARSLAYAMTGNTSEALREADRYDNLRRHHPEADMRILHNNSVAKLLELDSIMLRGELLYRQGKHLQGLSMLRKAVTMQDKLNYDERK